MAEYRNDETVVPKELGKGVSAGGGGISPQQRIWKFLGKRFVEAHIYSNGQATETELVEVGVFSAVLP
jgi:hypothetical protein